MGKKSVKHLMYVPFTGLGLYGGFRGNRWLRNRIKVFKQFVIPALQNQSSKNFTLWVGWRKEERENALVKELHSWLKDKGLDYVFTYNGLCFWDDKYPDEVARERLITNLHFTIPELLDVIGEAEEVYMTIQPSDDLYRYDAVEKIQEALSNDYQAFGFSRGYIANYSTKEVCEYNPTTNPPFYTIKFAREVFIDPNRHVNYAPIKSHEYVSDHLKYLTSDERGFLVGTHGENVSTYFNHPFKGEQRAGVLGMFGVEEAPPLALPLSLRKKIMKKLPYSWQRKVRYLLGERLTHRCYEWLRS